MRSSGFLAGGGSKPCDQQHGLRRPIMLSEALSLSTPREAWGEWQNARANRERSIAEAADQLAETLVAAGQRQANQEWAAKRLAGVYEPGLSWLQQWEYHPTEQFEKSLKTAAEVSTAFVPFGAPAKAAEIGLAAERTLLRAGESMFSRELGVGGPRASTELLDMMRAHDRTITFAREGSEELRYLNTMGAEANVGGPGHLHILLRENPSRAAAMEEFLHGTQSQLGKIDRLGVEGAEAHMADFLRRHSRLLGLE
jgi:hypothetical protein